MATKKNKLTLYIVIALIAGIVTGFYLNTNYVQQENKQIAVSSVAIGTLQTQLKQIPDTNSTSYKALQVQQHKLTELRNSTTDKREHKLELFALLSDIFMRLIKMIVAPLVFTTLVAGVAKVGDIKAVGRIGGKTLLWFTAGSFLSLFLGMALVNFFHPGTVMHLPLPDTTTATNLNKNGITLPDMIAHMVPVILFDAMARNEILQVVVFAIIFGLATAAIGQTGEIVIKVIDATAHVILKMTGYVMGLAPIAVYGAMTGVIARQGIGILQTYSIFIGEFYIGLTLLILVLLLACMLIIGKRTYSLIQHIKGPVLLAFSTNSSEAAFPRLMIELERWGCENRIVSFVLPLGYSFNLAGSMMYMTFAVLFIAQCYGIHLGFGTQFSMLLVLMLTSKGVAGVPRSALVVIAGTLATFNIPEAGLALLLGIDPLLDMGRSGMNVIGNGVATAVVSRWEKQ